jgi:hypothetical protein
MMVGFNLENVVKSTCDSRLESGDTEGRSFK